MLHAFELAWVNRLVAGYLQVVCQDHSRIDGPPPMDCLPCWALGKVQDDLANGRLGLAAYPPANVAGKVPPILTAEELRRVKHISPEVGNQTFGAEAKEAR